MNKQVVPYLLGKILGKTISEGAANTLYDCYSYTNSARNIQKNLGNQLESFCSRLTKTYSGLES